MAAPSPPHRPARRQGSLANVVGLIKFIPTPAAPPIIIPWTEYVTGLVLEMTSWNAWMIHLSLWDKEGSFLEQLIIAAGTLPEFQIQWDWDDGSPLAGAPIFSGGIAVYKPTFTPNGVGIDCDIIPRPAMTSNLVKKPRSFPNGYSVKQAFLDIANDQQDGTGAIVAWKLTDAAGNPTVQDTKATLPAEIVSNNETDIEFILNHLCKNAVDSQGRSGYTVFVGKNNEYHFHNRYYQASPIAAVYRYASAAESDVLSFEPEDASPVAAMIGSGFGTLFNSTDALNQIRTQQLTSADVGVPGIANVIWTGGGFRARVITTTQPTAASNIPARTPTDFQTQMAHRFELLSQLSYPANMTVLGTHNVTPYCTILVEFIKADGSVHYLSGIFTVASIKHTIGGQNVWQIEMTLTRNGIDNMVTPASGDDQASVDQNQLAQQLHDLQVPLQGVNQTPVVGTETYDPSAAASVAPQPPQILVTAVPTDPAAP